MKKGVFFKGLLTGLYWPGCAQSLNNPARLQQLLEQYPVLVTVLQSGGIRK